MGGDPRPGAGVVESRSLKSTGVGGEERGNDGGKKVRGRKRRPLVDTENFVLEAKVHSAEVITPGAFVSAGWYRAPRAREPTLGRQP